jgi:uncharacterized protein (TIGR02246 family)
MDATEHGDIQSVLRLMTDDALFLVPGKPPMTKAGFEAASKSQASAKVKIHAKSEVQEVQVEGTMAYMWSNLTVTMTQEGKSQVSTRTGQTLTVFRKVDGRWLLCRDANLLTER